MDGDGAADLGRLIAEARDIKRIARDPSSDPAWARLYRMLRPVYTALSGLKRRSPSQQMIVDDLADIFGFKDKDHK